MVGQGIAGRKRGGMGRKSRRIEAEDGVSPAVTPHLVHKSQAFICCVSFSHVLRLNPKSRRDRNGLWRSLRSLRPYVLFASSPSISAQGTCLATVMQCVCVCVL